MRHRSMRDGLLAAVAVAALVLYILACTSFSPDDTQVLYPAFDTNTGVVDISVYDRTSGATKQLFLPIFLEKLEEQEPEPRLLRAQWMADGSAIVVAWPGTPGDSSGTELNVALVPVGGEGTTKLYYLPSLEEAISQLSRPLALAGSQLFVLGSSNRVVRLDLKTGRIKTHPCDGEILLYPSPRGDELLYLQEKPGDAEKTLEMGRMNPDTFATKPAMEFTNAIADGGFIAFGADGNRVALVEGREKTWRLVIHRRGQADFARPLEFPGEEVVFGSAAFSPKGDVVYATYLGVGETNKSASYGLMEIPVGGEAIRRTVLVPKAKEGDSESVLYLQLGLSHDGKTAAVATTYLAVGDEAVGPEDCALFLVDLKDPKRPVTKVPIPQPGKQEPPVK